MPITKRKPAASAARRSATPTKAVAKVASNRSMVDDPSTGLIWCKDPIKVASWSEAEAKAKACRVGGHDDWRMPTVKELISIVDYGKRDPAIDTKVFNMPKDDSWMRFWSSSPVVGWPEGAWYVNFHYGGVDGLRTYGGFVRPVRAARPRQ